MVLARRWSGENGESLFNGDRVSFEEEAKVLEMGWGDGCTTVRMYLMPRNCPLEKGWNFRLCIFYHN